MATLPGRPLHTGPKTFDDTRLSAMVEPLKVRVDRIKNNQRMPIPLPDSNSGEPNGSGWTKEEVRELEAILVNHWSGGGLYEITVTDSSENPIAMKWQPYWPPQEYPEKVPPPLQEGRAPDAAPIQPLFPGARMPFVPPTPPVQLQSTQPLYASPYPMPPPPPVGTPQYSAWSAEAELRRLREENERQRIENERRDREAREEKHRAELERQRTADNDRFAKLEHSIMTLAGSLKEANTAPKGPTQAELDMQRQIAELKEQTRRAEERAEASRREAEADRRENQLREQMRLQAEEARRAYETTQQQIANMQREFQTMIANLTTQLTSASNKSDPLIQMMLENARQHADMVKEIARENRAAMERVQANVMNPREMMALARESQQGVEQAIERTTKLTSTVLDMQNRVLETALQTQPQGNGVIDAVTQGMSNVKEFLERFVTSKSKEAVAQAQAQAEIAHAQARAVEIHARATNPQAFAPAELAGPAMPAQAFTPPPPPSPEAASTAAPTTPRRVERLWGRTDEEWFGPVLGEVLQLRAGVQEFLTAVKRYEQTGEAPAKIEDVPGTHPAGAARGISMAVAVAQQRGLIIPALVELLIAGNVGGFVDVLLPDASPQYRDEVVRMLQGGGDAQAEVEEEEDEQIGEGTEDDDGDAGDKPSDADTSNAIRSRKPGRKRRN